MKPAAKKTENAKMKSSKASKREAKERDAHKDSKYSKNLMNYYFTGKLSGRF